MPALTAHPLVTPPEVGRPVAPDGIVRCMGCTPGIVVTTHRCAGDRPLLIIGGYCQCPEPGCGPNSKPAGRRARRDGSPTVHR